MSEPLPSNADLGKLRDNAKILRDLVRGGVEGAVELVRANHPRLGSLAVASPEATVFKLADAQLTLARHYGFASWPRLKAQIELIGGLARSPHTQPVGQATDADEFLRLACLTYGTPMGSRPTEAAALLARSPGLCSGSIHAAAAAGDLAAARALLAADPGLASVEGGPFRWPPLLYLAYSRIEPPGADPLAVASLLLGAGADPNAGFLWEGLIPPFTALTGAFGGGERGEPPHAHALDLARLLLEAGADPNDGQAVYNRGMGDNPVARDDTEWLELLLSYGLGQGDGGPWVRLLAPKMPTPAQLLCESLHHAAEFGLVNRVRLLLAAGADPNTGYDHQIFAGRTPYQGAVRHGQLEVAQLLADAGADTSVVDELTAATGALLAGRQPSADLIALARQQRPDLLNQAAGFGRADAVRLLVQLGWDVNARHGTTALHSAAYAGHADMVRLLLSLGADRTIVDTEHHSTPKGWAEFAGHAEVATLL